MFVDEIDVGDFLEDDDHLAVVHPLDGMDENAVAGVAGISKNKICRGRLDSQRRRRLYDLHIRAKDLADVGTNFVVSGERVTCRPMSCCSRSLSNLMMVLSAAVRECSHSSFGVARCAKSCSIQAFS